MDKDVMEIGGRAIYEFRAHPRRAPWAKAAAETRASYRARMQELVNALSRDGYAIVEGPPEPTQKPVREKPPARAKGKNAGGGRTKRR